MLIRHWHIPIMGFTQTKWSPSGVERLWRKLRTVCVGEQSSLIHPQEWNANWQELAEFIWRNSEGVESVRCNIYAYSWGCGHGFVKLSRALWNRGIPVAHAVLSDPVYHHWFKPWRGLFRATWNPPIIVPANVHEVDWFYQRQNTPQGVYLRAVSPSLTRIHDGRELQCSHQYMDDAKEFHDLVLQIAEAGK